MKRVNRLLGIAAVVIVGLTSFGAGRAHASSWNYQYAWHTNAYSTANAGDLWGALCVDTEASFYFNGTNVSSPSNITSGQGPILYSGSCPSQSTSYTYGSWKSYQAGGYCNTSNSGGCTEYIFYWNEEASDGLWVYPRVAVYADGSSNQYQ